MTASIERTQQRAALPAPTLGKGRINGVDAQRQATFGARGWHPAVTQRWPGEGRNEARRTKHESKKLERVDIDSDLRGEIFFVDHTIEAGEELMKRRSLAGLEQNVDPGLGLYPLHRRESGPQHP
jgi:hypothetical protein